jgi:preprotein translocase subunit SecE
VHLKPRWGFKKNKIMAKFGNYIQEAYDELVHKVSWPTWDELQQTTIIVLVSLIITTIVIFGMDFGAEKVLTFLYGILGK